MNDTSRRCWKAVKRSLIQVLRWQVPGVIEDGHEDPTNSPCSGQLPHTSAEYPRYMSPVDLTHRENEKRSVLVGQPEETRKAEF